MPPALRAVARSQRGLVTRGQCERAGFSQTDLRRMTRKHGPWVVVRIGVYLERSSWEVADTGERSILFDYAAHLVMTTEHVMSHDSAARALGIPMLRPLRGLVHITREGVGGSRTEGGVKHHLTRCELAGVVRVSGMPVTSPARTGLDLAREHGRDMGVCALDHLLHHGLPDRELEREQQVMKSWPGIRCVRRCIALADGRAESMAETLARLLLVEMGFENIDVGWPLVAGGRLFWTDLRIGCHVVEVDGFAKYLPTEVGGLADKPTLAVLRDERSRQTAICAEGLGMSRLVWDDLLGRARQATMDRVAREYAVTAARFGHRLPPHLAEQAAHIRRTRPRRRSA